MNYLYTRELYKRQCELQDEINDLESELADAQEVVNEAQEALNECEDTEEQEDLADALNEATAALEDAEKALADWRNEYQTELEELDSLENEVGREWMRGETLIYEDDFKEYAQDLAEELGMDRNQPWPYSCIDWDQAAEELKMDYSSCEYQGSTYYFRS